VDDVLQLLVTTYSLAGDRVPPAPPLYSADEAQLREGLSDVIMALASQAAAQDTSARQQCEGAALLWQHLQSLPRTHALLHEVGEQSNTWCATAWGTAATCSLSHRADLLAPGAAQPCPTGAAGRAAACAGS
jgi:hypothetical protein